MGAIRKVGNFVNKEVKKYCQQKAKEKRQQEHKKEGKR